MANLKVKEGITTSYSATNIDIENSFAQIGMVLPFIGAITQSSSSGIITTTAPNGWLLCNGNTFLQTKYPRLYAILGNSTTLPDLRGKFIVGTTNSSEVRSSYGQTTHSHALSATVPATSATTWAAHNNAAVNNVTAGPSQNHTHSYNITSNIAYRSESTFVNYVAGNQANVHLRTHTHSLSVNSNSSGSADNHAHNLNLSATSTSASGNHAHNSNISGNFNNSTTLVPQIAVNYIIKVDS
jgi:microcystin-dependent protein